MHSVCDLFLASRSTLTLCLQDCHPGAPAVLTPGFLCANAQLGRAEDTEPEGRDEAQARLAPPPSTPHRPNPVCSWRVTAVRGRIQFYQTFGPALLG